VPVSDGAGEVLEVGEGVSEFKRGDRVAGCFFQNWPGGKATWDVAHSALGGAIDGVLAEEVVLSETGAVLIPEHLGYEEAATLPCAGLTAWNGLVTRGNMVQGQTVLLLGTGGVSIFGLQFAVAAGAKAVITSSHDEKLGHAKKLGAIGVVNYKTTPDWHKEVLKLTENRGVDQVLEVGGVGTLEKSMKSLNINGHIALIGVLAGSGAQVNPFPLALKNATMSGIYVGSREDFLLMNAFIAEHKLKPVIDRTFDFAHALDAYRYLESGAHFGKVVITV
jgi:NADPH:quinone reductase-like Zn-dependent oxidoreductase